MNFTVQAREAAAKGKGPNRQLRAQGMAPGIIYGMGEPQMVQMRVDYATRFIHGLKGMVHPVDLTIEDGDKSSVKKVIVRDFQFSNWGDKLIHVDFMEVDDNTVIKAEIPIETSEECAAVKAGMVLQVIRRKIPVMCAIKHLPEHLFVDVTDLEHGMSIHMGDIDYPEGVKPVIKGRNPTVITVAGRRQAIVEEEVAVEGEEAAATEEAAE